MSDDAPRADSIGIIRLTPERWEAYRDIRLQGLREDPQAFGGSFAEESAYPQEKWIQRAGNPYSFLALENGLPMGTASAFVDEADEQTAYIVGVFVSREARGKGNASRLMSAVLEKLRQNSAIRKVMLAVNRDQTAAVKLYQKLGFRITGEEAQLLGDGKEHTAYWMELVIRPVV